MFPLNNLARKELSVASAALGQWYACPTVRAAALQDMALKT